MRAAAGVEGIVVGLDSEIDARSAEGERTAFVGEAGGVA